MNVFVHFAHGAGRTSWKMRYDNNAILGVNHDNLYGYRQAEEMGCRVDQSEDTPEPAWWRYCRMALRRIVGFDVIHAWSNRKGILDAQVVWTHTEKEAMAVLLLFKASKQTRPKIIAQNIWVMDEWETYSAIRKNLYRFLLSGADILTFHSDLNCQKAREIFPDIPIAVVRYGIRSDLDLAPPDRESHSPVRVLTIGNDRHRDWDTFCARSVRDNSLYTAKMIVGRNPPDLTGIDNFCRERPQSNDELFALYGWADIVVVPLTPNLHASGITAIQEATLFGVPVVCSDVGGLRGYFSEDEVTYVPPGDSAAIRAAIDLLSANPQFGKEKAARALARMKTGNLNSKAYVAAHVDLSRQIIPGRQWTASSSRPTPDGGPA